MSTHLVLPIELWAELLFFLPTQSSRFTPRKHALKAISLTCSSLRSLAQPLLFKNLLLDLPSENILPRVAGISDLLNSRPEAGRWTKELVVRGEDGRASLTPYLEARAQAAHDDFSKLFMRMQSIRRLQLTHMPCPASLIAHIWRSNPHSLTLRTCAVSDESLIGSGYNSNDLTIKELSIGGYHSLFGFPMPTWVRLIVLPSIASLSLSDGATSVAYRFIEQHSSHLFTNLHSLDIESPTPAEHESFVAFLAACPNLLELRFNGAPYLDHVVSMYSFPAGSLKHLSTFSGPITHAQALVPGRPVTKIVLSFDDVQLSPVNVLSLSQSSATITTLHVRQIRWEAGYTSMLGELLRGLTELEIQVAPQMRMGDILAQWQALTMALPRLRLLLFANRDADGRSHRHMQKAVLERIAAAAGSSLKFAIFQIGEMWKLCEDGTWRCAETLRKRRPVMDYQFDTVDSSYDSDDPDELDGNGIDSS